MNLELQFSILLASRNEGERLQRTVDDLLLHSPVGEFEIIVVDDASEDSSADFLADSRYAEKQLQAVRNEAHRGLIYSRARAAELARGHLLTFLDAHCAVSPGWLEALAAELDGIDGRGLVVPALHKLEPKSWTIDFESSRSVACTISSPFLDFAWTEPQELDGRTCTCTIGGGAWMCSREWYRHIGGLDQGMRVWGLENIDFPLRTWLAGGWCLAAEQVAIGHLYNQRPHFLMREVELAYNKIRAAHNAFSAETFSKVVESLFRVPGFRQAFTRVHGERKSLGPFKDYIESIRKRSDSWLIDTFRLPLLDSPEYYLVPRKQQIDVNEVPRPAVSLIISASGRQERIEPLLSSILEKTTYGNYDILLVFGGSEGIRPGFLEDKRYRNHPRIRLLHSSVPLSGGMAENIGANATSSEFLVFLPEDALIPEENWLEEFLLLAERRPRLLMACPRTRWVTDSKSRDGSGGEDLFEVVWDWEAPYFSREIEGEPLSEGPYQVLSCPDTALFVRRRAFVTLGGFESTVQEGARPVMDLAIKGWLSGYEVYCHPGNTVFRRREPGRSHEDRADPTANRWRHYAQVLPALHCFTNSSRLRRCEAKSLDARPLLRRHAPSLERGRVEFLSRAKFDDDWLFFKFHIEEPA